MTFLAKAGILFQLVDIIVLSSAAHISRAASHVHDAFEQDLPRRPGPRNLRRRPKHPTRFRRTAAADGDVAGAAQSPPEIKRNESSFCYAGNYHTPELRQAEGSNEPLVDPPEAVPDPYGWLRDETREDPTVLNHLLMENNYTQQVVATTEDLRQELYDELVSRIQETDYSTPRMLKANGQYVYYSRTNEGSGYRLYCRAPVPEGDLLEEGEITAKLINWDGKAETPIFPGEEVYLDGNEVASGHKFSDIKDVAISPSERYVAYTVDNVGNEKYTLAIKDLTTGSIVRDYGQESGPGLTTGDAIWGKDDSNLYVLKTDDAWRPYQVYQLSIDLDQEESIAAGQDQDTLTLLFEEPNQLFWTEARKSADGKYLFMGGYSSETSYVKFIDLENSTEVEGANHTQQGLPKLPVVAEKREGVYYDVEHQEGQWLISSNERDGKKTPNFRLLISPAVPNSADLWEDFTDEKGMVLFDGSDGDRSLSKLHPFSNHLALEGREGGMPRVWILDMKRNLDLSTNQMDATADERSTLSVAKTTQVTFEEEAHEVSVSGNALYDIDRIRIQYSSLTTPSQTMSIDMNNATSAIVIKEKFVPNYDKSLYESHRAFVKSRDGKTMIPYSMVFRSDLVGNIMKDGVPNDQPVLLYGYGSYGESLDLDFSSSLLPLLDRGIVFVQAHVRGGGEMGREWYESAKYLNKKRTFEDFVDVARYLVGQDGEGSGKITSPEKLAIRGISAGGLLVGASMNAAPELFRVAILDVPFVDVLCTMTDSSIPLTVGEWEEWGNPNEEKYFEYMLSYSPMNSIRNDTVYPSTLVLGGLHDTRVQYWEPAKYAATLRHIVGQTYTPDQFEERPILLKTDMDAGHSSASDRYKSYRERAFWNSFVLDQLGVVGHDKNRTEDSESDASRSDASSDYVPDTGDSGSGGSGSDTSEIQPENTSSPRLDAVLIATFLPLVLRTAVDFFF